MINLANYKSKKASMLFQNYLKWIFLILLFMFPIVYAQEVKVTSTPKKRHESHKTLLISLPTHAQKLMIEVHYQYSSMPFAMRVREIIEEDFSKILNYFDYVPRERLHIMINKRATEANGMASVFPRNTISLNDYPPVGDEHLVAGGDWVRSLLVHEFAHIVTLEMTHGYLQFFRSIFGSTFKWAGIIPAWFAEGVAVWVESTYTRDGRLKNPHMAMELVNYFQRQDSCRTIDCLNNPGHFPYGQLPYWAGSFFLADVEERKPQTLKCLFFKNSKSLPFSLSRVFRDCTGEDLSLAFDDFRKRFVKKYADKASLITTATPLKYQGEKGRAVIKWQKGHSLQDKYWSYLVDDDGVEKLVQLDLKTREQDVFKLSENVAQIERASPFMDKREVVLSLEKRPIKKGLVVGALFNHDARIIHRINKKKQKMSYYLPLSETQYLFFRYENSAWSLYLDSDKKESVEQLVVIFPFLLNLGSPHFVKDQAKTYLGFTLNSSYEDSYSYHLLRLGKILKWDQKKRIYRVNSQQETKMLADTIEVYKDSSSIEFLDTCKNKIVLKRENKDLLILEVPTKKTHEIEQVEGSYVDSLLDLRLSADWVVAIRENIKTPIEILETSCEKFLQNISGTKTKKTQGTSIASDVGLQNEKIRDEKLQGLDKSLSLESKSYPKLSHFRPHYWMLFYSSNNGFDQISANTTLNDPLRIHTFSLGASYYLDLAKTVPDLSYTMRIARNFLTLDYNRSFAQSSLGRGYNEFLSKEASFGRRAFLGGVSYVPSFYILNQDTQDFISHRESLQFGLQQTFNWDSERVDNFFDKFFFSLRLLNQKTKNFESFWGGMSKLKTDYKLGDILRAELAGSYGKYEKRGFASGVMYGGGATSSFGAGNVFHEFYALPLNDVFGNEISAGRLQFQTLFSKPYHGNKLFPLYFKEWSLVLGGEAIHGERTFFDSKIWRNELFTAIQAGVNLKADMFYALPVDLDFLITKITNKSSDVGFLLLFKSQIFPSGQP
ncbi:MAG: hypothetical protein KBD63_06170 [Bacteriovoracaceae bacterium]|nr:hypothetical protein [Bacteriovoracaceae bacterium]